MNIEKYLKNINDFENKLILLTGGTAGIGLEASKILLSKKAKLVWLIRNTKKAQEIKESLSKNFPDAYLEYVEYDQSSFKSIDSALEEINSKYANFDSLICNAGIFHPKEKYLDKKNIPITISTNAVGLFYFLNKIKDKYQNKHIIIQGSVVACLRVKKNYDLLDNKPTLFKQYAVSKSCSESIYYHFLINDTNNRYSLVEPGITGTDIIRDFNPFIRFLGKIFLKVASHSPKKASLTIIKALSIEPSFVVPRGMFTFMGYPKIKKFPKKRKKEFLIPKLKAIIQSPICKE